MLIFIRDLDDSSIPDSVCERTRDQTRRGELHRPTNLFAFRRGDSAGQFAGTRHPVNVVQTRNEALDLK